jgi:hypothetical protein
VKGDVGNVGVVIFWGVPTTVIIFYFNEVRDIGVVVGNNF